jgi:formylglycine-generating enzyme required for sulfatase activity
MRNNLINFLVLIIVLYSHLVMGAETVEFAEKVIREHGLTGAQSARLKTILSASYGVTRNIGTENDDAFRGPNNSFHPITRGQCKKAILETKIIKPSKDYEKLCKSKWMAPIPNTDGKPTVCIDQFEFPDIPCEYPLVWVPSHTAHLICQSMGKRLCNSHEWEGACAGKLDSVSSYRFDIENENARRNAINSKREKVWAFQSQAEFSNRTDSKPICGIFSRGDPDVLAEVTDNILSSPIGGLSKGCAPDKSAYKTCGTNTWPAGYKYRCKSRNDVYDLHGNVAEVVNLPTHQGNIAHGETTGFTERKGSFFVDRSSLNNANGEPKYPDDCRVRQPYEHMKEVKFDTGHSFYQEGFRCCKDIQ